MFLFSHLCCYGKDQTFLEWPLGHITRLWKQKTRNYQKTKTKTKKIIHQQLKQPYLYAHSKIFFSYQDSKWRIKAKLAKFGCLLLWCEMKLNEITFYIVAEILKTRSTLYHGCWKYIDRDFVVTMFENLIGWANFHLGNWN